MSSLSLPVKRRVRHGCKRTAAHSVKDGFTSGDGDICGRLPATGA
mgnify:CR=1 FL=1